MTKEEMEKVLKMLSLKLRYNLSWESETETINIITRKPAKIIDGFLRGCQISLMRGCRAEGLFCVWTEQKMRANKYAGIYRMKVRLMDREAELWVPAQLADKVLPLFGANIKRTMSEAQKEASKKGIQALNLARNRPADAVKQASMPEIGVR